MEYKPDLEDGARFTTKGGNFVEVHIDYDAGYANPRHFDSNMGTFITWIDHYESPDKNYYAHDRDRCIEDIMDRLGLLDQYEKESELRDKELEPFWEAYYDWHRVKCVGEKQIRAFTRHKVTEAKRHLYRWYLQSQPTTPSKPVDDNLAWLVTQAAKRDDILLLPVEHFEYAGTYGTDEPRECLDASYEGVIFTTDERIKELYDVDEVTDKERERALKELKREVEYYSQWASGNVWHYTMYDKGGHEIDSCCGFIGEDTGCMEHMTGELEETSMDLDEWVDSVA